ncbi:MAG TPA: mismatch-specific DNA-glycosylase [Stellaceae bacterium]|nr:mismatch-specific DNA-glycosylase [Stellaceae bacterium]
MDAQDIGRSLPDLLRDGLDVVFVGINPSTFSVLQGHYFARRTNRFWPCFSRSRLSHAARRRMGLERLEPVHDRMLLEDGFGFTDAVKRATARAADLTPSELALGVPSLLAKIERHRPKIACFHGITAYRQVHQVITGSKSQPGLGLQSLRIARTLLFIVPNPSPANAHYTPAEQTRWYDRLADCLAAMGN